MLSSPTRRRTFILDQEMDRKSISHLHWQRSSKRTSNRTQLEADGGARVTMSISLVTELAKSDTDELAS